ncbi:hypothetical protein V7O62_12305 [Methanolobus sp. ZRKC2]|uniref:hypothetical protein n=1 Tax=Methanolobus sp. ZRKC2 TaxID=3125783 RepID=UPI00324871D0
MMTESQKQVTPGAYYIDEEGNYNLIPHGSYYVDENGKIGEVNQEIAPTVNWQSAIDNFKWDEVHRLIENWGSRGARERTYTVLGSYALAALVISLASVLAYQGIVEGQALVGFLGAAIGYILSKGEIGLKG